MLGLFVILYNDTCYWFHIISYHIISYLIISYHIISCHIISYHTSRLSPNRRYVILYCIAAWIFGNCVEQVVVAPIFYRIDFFHPFSRCFFLFFVCTHSGNFIFSLRKVILAPILQSWASWNRKRSRIRGVCVHKMDRNAQILIVQDSVDPQFAGCCTQWRSWTIEQVHEITWKTFSPVLVVIQYAWWLPFCSWHILSMLIMGYILYRCPFTCLLANPCLHMSWCKTVYLPWNLQGKFQFVDLFFYISNFKNLIKTSEVVFEMPKSESLNSQQSTKAQQSGNWWEFSGDALFSSLKQAQVVCPTRTFALKIMISRFYLWFYVCFLVTYSCPEYSGTLCTHFLTNFPESLVLGFRN